jgi:hypothetical protein
MKSVCFKKSLTHVQQTMEFSQFIEQSPDFTPTRVLKDSASM